jgi:hypothetical protein
MDFSRQCAALIWAHCAIRSRTIQPVQERIAGTIEKDTTTLAWQVCSQSLCAQPSFQSAARATVTAVRHVDLQKDRRQLAIQL